MNKQKKSRPTLLSQLPTARKSATGQKESEEIESGGGSATSTSFSGAEETLAAVGLAPKNDMVQQESVQLFSYTCTGHMTLKLSKQLNGT